MTDAEREWVQILVNVFAEMAPDGTPGSYAQCLELDGLPALRKAGFGVVRKADVKHLLDVFINGGMVEAEDEAIIDRLWAEVNDS